MARSSTEVDRHDHLFRLLEQAGRRFRQEFAVVLADRRLDVPVSGSRLRALQHVPSDGIRPTDLATVLGMSKQSLGELVRDLESHRLVERRADPGDGRAWVLRTTPRGRRLSAAIDDVAAEAERRLAVAYGPHEFAVFRDMASRLASDAPARTLP